MEDERRDLEADFYNAMQNIYKRCDEEIGYRPILFRNMLAEYGDVETAKKLIGKREASDGFTKLLLAGRKDLTVEAVVFHNQKYWPLFSQEELDICRERLGKQKL